ncbi:response regulator receiver protein [Methylobacterium sp. Leaf469]|jgi:CheY-like chemotaxis protein|uniref:response regulator n=1 Tax=unclassified Methylobacterium TaxID=2615210 RepID=UPI0006FBB653|nr:MULTISPECIES: response regulator [unclassified Methylobacterium]USU30326.1 response regulator [Methylobacterium sp. OTU13CASTA1]KQO72959.1 response regulator receiver protein [Methylobacterium sp. Leaf87]KQP30322.1 response regulator receiver protein [Methylobacterium sp. Leaf102]KQP32253.1 response regulator receiver protein [Methylobacterium sp. Leaf100]KQP66034.1 response regulator receiver protein [Methylobacterium sp. Leaf112]
MTETAPRVLIVEDEIMLLEVVAAELEDAGFTVSQATTAEIALSFIESDAAIDVLFTDIRLPGEMDGWQLAEAARRLRPGLPIIYATGFTQTPPRLAEGSVFFTKPYRANAIISAIRTLGGSGP